MWGELHEEKAFSIKLSQAIEAGKANRLFRELGATLYYDVYGFKALEYENWQSESLLHIELRNNGNEVDAQDDFDEIVALYPFALRPGADQSSVLQLVSNIIKAFDARAYYMGDNFVPEQVQKDWDSCNDFLLKEWGEEPGSKSLAIMIHENYT